MLLGSQASKTLLLFLPWGSEALCLYLNGSVPEWLPGLRASEQGKQAAFGSRVPPSLQFNTKGRAHWSLLGTTDSKHFLDTQDLPKPAPTLLISPSFYDY